MPPARRWIRLDVGWQRSSWIEDLTPGGRLAWVMLLGYVKAEGSGGTVKAMTVARAAREWDIPREDVAAMLEAAAAHPPDPTDQPALVIRDGSWCIPTWEQYQKPDLTAADRKRKQRGTLASTPATPDDELSRRDNRDSGVTRRVTETLTLTGTLTETPPSASLREGSPAPAREVGASVNGANGNGAHPQPSEPTPPDDPDDPLTPWLGPHAALVEDNPLITRRRDRRTLYAEYGPPGARSGAWKLEDGGTLPAEHRPRVFALALAGYAREGNRKLVTNQFAGMLRKLAGQEATLPRGSPTAPDAPLTAAQMARYREIRRDLEDGGMHPDQAAAEAGERARRE